MKNDADIIVVGGGLSGLTLSLLLGQCGFKTVCVDRDNLKCESDADQRTTVISYASQKILNKAGIWDTLLPWGCPIHDIEILDGNSSVLMDFSQDDLHHEVKKDSAFGWVIENRLIKEALFKAVKKQKNITHIASTKVEDFEVTEDCATVILDNGKKISASLIIGADGRQSFTRQWMDVPVKSWSYHQTALVCMVNHEKPHGNIAVEHFMSSGPFAILPMTDSKKGQRRSALVWTLDNKKDKSVLEYSDSVFNAALNARFPARYGHVQAVGDRMTYPLNFSHAQEYVKLRMALIADAAHGIHPIAGQGLNLGLRDVASLIGFLEQARSENQDIGSLGVLKQYQTARRPDNIAMAATTDMINKIFSNNMEPMRAIRKFGLKSIQHLKPTKRLFMRQAMGIAGYLPQSLKEK